jgi:hypothetical protein
MDEPRHSTLVIELPVLSDESACELLALTEQLFATLDSHYYAQVARHRQRLREQQRRAPPLPIDPNEDPF